jgi:transcriptional regulator with XRE-family HTH domain
MSSFGSMVAGYRKSRGVLQRALAERVGLSPSEFSRLEKGKRRPPPLDKVLRMIAALNLTRDDAEDLLRTAAYSPSVLDGIQGVSYSSPPTPTAPDDGIAELTRVLGTLDPKRRAQCTKAFVALVTALTTPTVGAERQLESHDAKSDER